jgi:hypothetical protein
MYEFFVGKAHHVPAGSGDCFLFSLLPDTAGYMSFVANLVDYPADGGRDNSRYGGLSGVAKSPLAVGGLV